MNTSGVVLAKGWLLGLQFYTLLRDGLYFKLAARADAFALRIREAFRQKGIPEYVVSSTNQQFVILTPEQAEKLAPKYVFEKEGNLEDGRLVVRFCTSWSTEEGEVEALIADIADA